jgi:GH24 family phage-related lysozyme (muramidase)
MSRVGNPYGQKRVPRAYDTGDFSQGLAPSQGIFIGVVKKNDDPQRMGRLQVWIEDFHGDPDDESSWISVNYASPFAGTTSLYDQGANVTEYDDTIKSYGWWAVPPDIDARVLVGFAGGKLDLGYWFACLYQRGTQVTVPGIPALKTYAGENIPAAPKNKRDLDQDQDKYVEHKPMSNALKKQGLETDRLRGITTHSALRESPSKVLGLLTPGQHQFILDDGDAQGNSKLIRLRTTNGTQLLLDDQAGHIYLISKNGENWLELSADGHVHLYASGDINVRSQNNINFYADNNINLEAGNSVNVKAQGSNINLQAGTDVNSFAGGTTRISSIETSNINSGVGHFETAGVIHMNGPTAEIATGIQTYQLAINQGITESICNTVPEHEPWQGHSGLINPVGYGNQQMKEDPSPSQQPRQPEPSESGSTLITKEEQGPTVNLTQAKTSDQGRDLIKEQNSYSPVNVNDNGVSSGGYGSVVMNQEVETTTTAKELASAKGTEAAQNSPSVDGKTRGYETANQDSKARISIDEKALKDFQSAVQAAENAYNLENMAQGQIAAVTGADKNLPKLSSADKVLASNLTSSLSNSVKSGELLETLTKGISADKASKLLNTDLAINESAVKNSLSSLGVQKIPQNVFDGLVSFQNQTGDINYAYVNGEKIDLTQLYRSGEWDRAAGFIAADERDRPRRIAEATLMTTNSYGNPRSEDDLVQQGLNRANELIAKGKLNQQTGAPATAQQALAASSSYFDQIGKVLPNTKFVFNNIVTSNSLFNKLNKQPGPWPY